MRRVLVILLSSLLIAGCSGPVTVSQSPEPGAGGWQRLPDFPLAERSGPVVAWTGREVLAVGGETGDECPPNADCVRANAAARDGAALDLRTRRWRVIAEAPLDLPANIGGVLVGGRLFVLTSGTLIAYDPAADRWTTVRRDLSDWYTLVADRDRLILLSSSDEQGTRPDLTFDPGSGHWGRLPADPLGRSFDRSLISTEAGLVLGGHDVVPSPGAGANPSYLRAALLDRRTNRWRTFGPSGVLGGNAWAASGDRVISVGLGGSDGGGDPPGDYGRVVPNGGSLDLGTGAWAGLTDAPDPTSGGWPIHAPGGPWTATDGFLYDPAADSWQRIPRPEGAGNRPGPALWAGDQLVVITTEKADRNDWAQIRDNRSWAWDPRPRQ